MNQNSPIKISVVYVYPTMGGDHDVLAARFADSYTRNFPGLAHDLVVVSNGGEPTPAMLKTFDHLKCNFIIHDDTGWDIGAYRKAANDVPCDLMVFFGGSAHLRGERWLERMEESYRKRGRAIYGAMGSLGHTPHIRTTGFWMPPELLKNYPYKVTSEKASRYQFEHGENSITTWVLQQQLKAWVVTWDAEYEVHLCDTIKNGFHNGDQSALLVFDRLTNPPYYSP